MGRIPTALAVLVLMLAAPAAAPAAAAWEDVGDPIPSGSTALAVVNGVPYVGIVETDLSNGFDSELTVRRWNGAEWELVGGPLNAEPAFFPDLAVSNGRLWIAWRELGSVHIARLAGDEFRQVGSGYEGPDFISGFDLTVFEGRPYLAFYEPNDQPRLWRVLRTAPGSRSLEPVDAGREEAHNAPRLVVARGELYLFAKVPNATVVKRLNDTRTGWDQVSRFPDAFVPDLARSPGVYDAVYGRGALHAIITAHPVQLSPTGAPQWLPGDAFADLAIVDGVRYAVLARPGQTSIQEFRRGGWRPLAAPSDGFPVAGAELSRFDGELWLLWVTPGVSHVARLVR
jgi:hypothetical protein